MTLPLPQLPDAADFVPPVAERCPDASELGGKCRHSDTCNGPRQRFQQKYGKALGRACPWWTNVACAKACELESA